MQHSYIDRYAELDSFIHRIDPRVKIITFFTFIIFIVLSNPAAYLSFFCYAVLLLGLIVISRIPFLFIFKKSLAVIPFVVLIAAFIPFIKKGDGTVLFWGIVIKSYLSVLSAILLTSSTKFTNFMKALEKLKVPRIFIMIMAFMYRYSFVLVDETQRMRRASESRSFGKRRGMGIIRTLSNIMGVLFVRSYERAERVYLAMCSRGFQGEVKTLGSLRVRVSDIVFLTVTLAILFICRSL